MYAIDLHCDTMSKLAERGRTSLLRENDLNVDIAKLQAGNFAAQFFALFVDMAKTSNPLDYCLQMVDRFHLELADNRQSIRLATNQAELVANQAEGKISAFLTIEEGGAPAVFTKALRVRPRRTFAPASFHWRSVPHTGDA